ncbi:MAG: cysteine desulfurase [Clostridia bacterium]|nr:cysteine desulfurase [Clostridia bacterium]
MLVYLDSSATTPMKSEVIEEMNRVMEKVYGNPSSVYSLGALAKEEIENARKKVAKVIGAKKEEIYFTSSGSEADNLAIIGIARANKSKGNHIITTKIEHKAVLNSCKKLEKEGFEITYLNVDENGRINFSELMNAINERTILISVMAINNEIGTIQDLEQIGKIAKYKGVIFHSDSVQAIGHLNINVKSINIDSLSISAHKFNGPKGVGAVYIKENVKFEPIIYGGHQERGKRAGTENIAGIVGLAKAIELATENITEKNMKVSKIRDYLKQKLLELDKRVKINCDSVYKSSSNLSVCFENINGKDMVLMLDMKGICVSTGSACNSSESSASHVLLATGISEHDAKNTIRFSLSENNTIEEMDYVIECIKEILNK